MGSNKFMWEAAAIIATLGAIFGAYTYYTSSSVVIPVGENNREIKSKLTEIINKNSTQTNSLGTNELIYPTNNNCQN